MDQEITAQSTLPTGDHEARDAGLNPCAATASHFLLAQGPTVLVLNQGTLALERRYQRHMEAVALMSVNHMSAPDYNELVVTCDMGKTARIWDPFTGDDIYTMAYHEPPLVAAWTRDGHVAFGNEKGRINLLQPHSGVDTSIPTTGEPITALAPSPDGEIYAIGYRDGTILLAELRPQFTYRYMLCASRYASPAAMLSWHSSFSLGKPKILAVQSSGGDLQVWSIPEHSTAAWAGQSPRVIREVRHEAQVGADCHWIAWLRNGRILEHAQGKTWVRDVKLKRTSSREIATREDVRGIAAHRLTASFFTIDPEHTVRRHDVDNDCITASAQHLPDHEHTPYLQCDACSTEGQDGTSERDLSVRRWRL